MTEDDALERFGMPAAASSLPEIRDILRIETEKESRSQGQGNTALMKLLCVHLFLHGHAEDSLLIWRAKTSSMDADASIDIQLLCGIGLDATTEFMRSAGDGDAGDALVRIGECVASGDFQGFSPDEFRSFWLHYYGDEDDG